MHDYTFCHARGCLLSETCMRAQKPDSEDAWFFSDEPFKIVDGKFDCAMYVGVNQINIFEQLKDIVNGESDGNKGNDAEGFGGTANGGTEKTE